MLKIAAGKGADASMRFPELEISFAADARSGSGLAVAYGFAASPFGPAILLFSEKGICGLGFGENAETLLADMKKRMPLAAYSRDDAAAKKHLAAIFKGERTIALHLVGTPWQITVWKALLRIRPGKTATYGELARTLKLPGAARAVGTAVGRNPVAWLVPCHRVLGANGRIAGYHWGIERKRAMLAAETI
jgi:AraC family transcriptional regulator, regulatory protein of adaptative response / methylated-DNA-[protein]-cysteine methyltransferase